jgi:hypothetical protein
VQEKPLLSRNLSSLGRFALMGILMLGMILHSLLPTGFMPSIDDGKITLVICSGMGEKTITVDAKDFSPVDSGKHDPSDGSSSCPYYLAQLTGLYPEQSSIVVPFSGSRLSWTLEPYQVIDARGYSISFARGPPILIV